MALAVPSWRQLRIKPLRRGVCSAAAPGGVEKKGCAIDVSHQDAYSFSISGPRASGLLSAAAKLLHAPESGVPLN